MKLYTKTGDDGSTGLFGGRRVLKCDARVLAYGEVDELNAMLGWCRVVVHADITAGIQAVQVDLFAVGAELAEAAANPAHAVFVPISDEHVQRLEACIDAADERSDPLRSFVLPGGSEAGARLHVARGACRRAERAIVALGQDDTLRPQLLQYLNRLGDLLFAWARLQNKLDGCAETPWNGA